MVGTNVKAMGPTMIHVAEEHGAPVALGTSDARFAGGTPGRFLDGSQCRSLGLRCQCGLELGKLLFDDCDISCEVGCTVADGACLH